MSVNPPGLMAGSHRERLLHAGAGRLLPAHPGPARRQAQPGRAAHPPRLHHRGPARRSAHPPECPGRSCAEGRFPARPISLASVAAVPGGARASRCCSSGREARGERSAPAPNAPLTLRAGGRLLMGNAAPQDGRELEAQLRGLLTRSRRPSSSRSCSSTCSSPRRAACARAATSTSRTRASTPPSGSSGARRPRSPSSACRAARAVHQLLAGHGARHRPGGAGKTSTLAALVNLIAEERADHILCLEDPVEIVHRPRRRSSTSARWAATPARSRARCEAPCARTQT